MTSRIITRWWLSAVSRNRSSASVAASIAGLLSPTLEPPALVQAFRALFAGQAAFYLFALFGPAAGKLGSLCRTFVVLNTAAVVGLYRFVRGAQKVTW